MEVDLFIPCFVDQLYPRVGIHMVKVLEKCGVTVHYNPNQTCCSQPAYNAGFTEEAHKVSEKFLKDFSSGRPIVAPSASCVGYVRQAYGQFFDNSSMHNDCKAVQSNLYEFSEFMVNVLHKKDVGANLEARVTYHDSCAALRECHIKDEPRELLRHVGGLHLVEMKDSDVCCGFGGTFSVKFGDISAGMASQKLEHAIATGATYIVSTDVSCLMHLDGIIQQQGLPIETLHLADVLVMGW
jgi:L-lactate dehydrogenase complex protein LldE